MKQPWFRKLTYGYIPATWQGWLIVAIYLFGMIKLYIFFDAALRELVNPFAYFIPAATVLTGILLLIFRSTKGS